MEDLKSLIVGILGGLAVIWLQSLWRAYRRRSLQDDLNFYELERGHLERMKKSSVEMSRMGFRSIFALFCLIALAHVLSTACELGFREHVSVYAGIAALIGWGTVLGCSATLFRRYDSLKDYAESAKRIDARIGELKRKLERT